MTAHKLEGHARAAASAGNTYEEEARAVLDYELSQPPSDEVVEAVAAAINGTSVEQLKAYLAEDHGGSCLKEPYTCMRCGAESILVEAKAAITAYQMARRKEIENG